MEQLGMNKMIYRKIKRLWNGLASLRDYEVLDAISKKENIRLECKNEYMTLSVPQLEKGFQISSTRFKSRYNANQMYELVDFRWKPDKQDKDQIKLFDENTTT